MNESPLPSLTILPLNLLAAFATSCTATRFALAVYASIAILWFAAPAIGFAAGAVSSTSTARVRTV